MIPGWMGRKTNEVAARWLARGALAALALVPLALPPRVAPAAAASSTSSSTAKIIELRIDGEIEPVMAEYIVGGIETASQTRADLILITVDTPGGLSTSLREIVQHILDSPVPVAVYVSPPGSRAASAGFFILLSADVAVMAPGTHTGAASPLLAIGNVPLQVDESLRKKILNDTTAYLRSFAGKRGRNVALAELAVTEGKAFTEKEALDGNLIDRVARSREDLLSQLDGAMVRRFDGSTTKLQLKSPLPVPLQMSARQRFLSRIVQPDVFFVLLIVGALGLYVEFTHPGLIAPGVVGGIAMVLALYAMHILPVNFAGVLLIALALALFILEAKFSSHGVLGIGGVVAMLLGALMLIRSPLTGAGVSLGVALGATLPFAVITVLLMRLVLRSRGWKQAAGAEQLIGAIGEITEPVEPADGSGRGMILVHGELWRARANEPISKGMRAQVVRIEGLTLYVESLAKVASQNR